MAIVEAVATLPCLSQDGIAYDLAELQDAFYVIRGELPVDVPDAEIVDALRTCPDYCGLHVNLYDLLLPHENELAPVATS